ncbi:unnamed protein product [Staurois parvus]|uniref:Uncharacterized protein n=1 Tax=Staurois parvus TaxID=386267 RepID=A0ABN9DM57_9NEOB|nr:unnamed protein product [Staurois parvus]
MQAKYGCRNVGAVAGRYGGNQDTDQERTQERRCGSRQIWRQPGYRPAVSDKLGQDQLSGSGTREQASG